MTTDKKHSILDTRTAAFFIILTAFIMEILLLGTHRMHGDESVYCCSALHIADGTDIFQSRFGTGKFPLVSAIIAVFIKFFGNNDYVTRLPNLIASILTFIFLYKAAAKLYDKKTGCFAILLLLLTRYFIVFGPTAFTDVFMTLFIVISTYCLAIKMNKRAGLFLGLAFASKYTAFYFLPIFMTAPYFLQNEKWDPALLVKKAVEILMPYLAVFSIVFLWSFFFESPRLVSFIEFNPVRFKGLINSETLKTGMANLYNLHLTAIGFQKPLICGIFAILLMLVRDNNKRRLDIFFGITVLMFYGMLFFMAGRGLPVYDRYMVVIMPFMAIFAGRGTAFVFETAKKFSYISAAVLTGAFAIFYGQPYFPSIKMGALYDYSDGIEKASEVVKKSGRSVLGVGAHYYVMTYYFYRQLLGDYPYTEMEKLKKYFTPDENTGDFLLVRTPDALDLDQKSENSGFSYTDNEIIEKFGSIPGVYFNRELRKNTEIYSGGRRKYILFTLEKKGPLKNPVFIIKEKAEQNLCVFGGKVALNSMTVIKDAGFSNDRDSYRIQYLWTILDSGDKGSRIYVHFKDIKGKMIFGADHYPAKNLAGFGKSGKNIVINDIDIITAPGMDKAVSVEIGLYDEKNGSRLGVTGTNNFILHGKDFINGKNVDNGS